MTTPAIPPEAVRLLNGFRAYQLVVAACRLKLPDLVAAGVGDPEAIAELTETHAPTMRRALRGLAAVGFFKEQAPGRYVSTQVSDAFRSDRPGLRNTAVMLAGEGYRAWGELMYCLQTGEPAFERVFGKSRWQKMADDPEDAARFNAAMVEITQRVAEALLAACDFGGVRTIVDIGGGTGALLTRILIANPDAEGILFDVPAGLAGARAALEAAGVADRVQLVAGDFFESVPAGADLYLLKSIIHDWDDERATRILTSCRTAMGVGSRLMLVERRVPDQVTDPDADLPLVMSDLQMMVVLGGRERTTSEYAALLEAAGLRMSRTIAMDSDFCAIEALTGP